jgi:uncharacterized protein YgfB (UPF0149 family)
MTERWQDEYAQMIEDCEKRAERLSEWEQSFIDSLSVQLSRGKVPTAKQIEKLSDIWERATARG